MPFQSQKEPLELSEAQRKQLQRTARSRTESGAVSNGPEFFWPTPGEKQFPPLPEKWAPTGPRSIAASTKLWGWELRRHSATCPAGEESGSSGAQHEPGWCRWPAANPKSSVMPRNCGPPIFWPSMPAATAAGPAIRVWRKSGAARSRRYSRQRRLNPTRCAITWKNEIRTLMPRWPESCVYTSKSSCCAKRVSPKANP